MLRLEDCLALCELTEDEVLAIAEHEHIPESMRELGLKLLLRNFVLNHPRCEERLRRQLHAVERRDEMRPPPGAGAAVDAQDATAEYKDGVLSLTLPKKSNGSAKRVAVS